MDLRFEVGWKRLPRPPGPESVKQRLSKLAARRAYVCPSVQLGIAKSTKRTSKVYKKPARAARQTRAGQASSVCEQGAATAAQASKAARKTKAAAKAAAASSTRQSDPTAAGAAGAGAAGAEAAASASSAAAAHEKAPASAATSVAATAGSAGKRKPARTAAAAAKATAAPARSAQAASVAELPGPAPKRSPRPPMESAVFGVLHLVHGANQAYIQVWENNKKTLLVACAKAQAQRVQRDHHDIIDELARWIIEQDADLPVPARDAVKAKRDSMLQP